jgi:GntR family transcriptional regulator
MVRVRKDDFESISDQLERIILEQIKSGDLNPGDRILSENVFAQIQGVSRSTVQKVYDRLVSKNILIRKPGKGTFVALPTTASSLSLLVGFSEKMRLQGSRAETKVLNIGIQNSDKHLSDIFNIPQDTELIVIERLRLITGIPFVVHYAALPYPLCKDVLNFDLEENSLTNILKFRLGFEIEKTEEFVSAYPARSEDVKTLKLDLNSPVLKVEGKTYDNRDTLLRYSVARYRADFVRLESCHRKSWEQGGG